MPWLIIEKGPERGRNVELVEGRKLVFGRDATADVVTTDSSFSRRHFGVIAKDGAWLIKDLDSTHGTFVNGWKITKPTPLKDGDTITAGESMMTFAENRGGRGLVGKVVAGYQIADRIGRGGMGTVYAAKQIALDREVALKVLSPKYSDNKTFVNRFFKEAQAAARLNHPNVVQVYDVREEQGLYLISLEMMDSGTIQDLATRERQLTIPRVLEIAKDAAKGLVYAEKKGIVHGDIKPDNLMINSDGHIKISDLGLARDAGDVAHQGDEGIFGTPHFIAPEQALGKATDTRSDIYSLGASLYRLVAGRTPFSGENVKEIVLKQIHEEPPDIRELRPDCPQDLADLIGVMMAKKPEDRFESAQDLLNALDAMGDDGTLHGAKKGGMKAAGAIALVLVVAVIGVIAMQGGEGDETPEKEPEPGGTEVVDDGTKPDDDRPDIDPEVERQTRELKVKGARLDAVAHLQKLERLGQGEDAEALKGAVQKFRDAIVHGPATDEAKLAQAEILKLNERIKKIEADAAAAAAAAAARRKKADEDFGAMKTQVTAAVDKDAFTDAISTALEFKSMLEGTHRANDADSLHTRILDDAKVRSDALMVGADAKIQGGDYAGARADLTVITQKFNASGKSGPAYTDILAYIAAATTKLGELATLEAQKAVSDRKADNALVFGVLNRYYKGMEAAFTPEPFLQEMTSADGALNTEGYRARLALARADAERVAAAKQAIAAHVKKHASNGRPLRLSGRRSGTVVAVDADGLTLERRGTTRVVKWTDLEPRLVYKQLLRRIDHTPRSSLDMIIMLLESGQLEDAKEEVADLLKEDSASNLEAEIRRIDSLIDREIAARALLERIAELYGKAKTDAAVWFELRRELTKLTDEYRDTRTFLIHSNGTTPLVTQY